MKTFSFLLAIALLTPLATHAEETVTETVAEEEATVKAGVTPASPADFLDRFGERMNLLFTADREKRVQKMLRFADERLEELRKMSEDGRNPRKIERALERYNDLRAKAEAQISEEQANAASDLLSDDEKQTQQDRVARMRELFAQKITDHEANLAAQQEKLPEAVRERVQQARERGIERLEELMKGMEEGARRELKEELQKRHESVKMRVIQQREERREKLKQE